MSTGALSLQKVYEGWEGHQLALLRAVTPLTPDQLTFRPAPHLQSVGELVSHIGLGRLWWFHKMGAPGSAALAHQFAPWTGDQVNAEDPAELRKWTDALEQLEQAIVGNHAELLRWLEASWRMIEATLTEWTVDDLAITYRHLFRGKMYAVSRQWTIWR
ncbi:MAG TPA: DinB family protein, partial [Ktedonobacterales bacterium]|nr:DinB family protein [Ktedonobacterales bacterium]